MKFGVVFPQTEFGHDAAALKDYAQTAEALGYDHILAYDHVLGANPQRPGGWKGPYTFENPFLEVFVLFSFLAGVTQKIEFTTGILILPQRQTALVAKQAATLDASAAAACASAWASAGTKWSTGRSTKTSTIAASEWKSRFKCCRNYGRNRW